MSTPSAVASVLILAVVIAGCGQPGDGGRATTATLTSTSSEPATNSTTRTEAPFTGNQTVYDEATPIALTNTQPATFGVPTGAASLLVRATMNASSSGPYVLYGENGVPPRLVILEDGTERAHLDFEAMTANAAGPGAVAGPEEASIALDGAGEWTIEFAMGGSNLRAAVTVVAQAP